MQTFRLVVLDAVVDDVGIVVVQEGFFLAQVLRLLAKAVRALVGHLSTQKKINDYKFE